MYCGNCGKKLDQKEIFCGNCGKRRKDSNPPPGKPFRARSSQNRNVAWIWIWTIGGVISFSSDEIFWGFICLIIAFVAYQRGKFPLKQNPKGASTNSQNSQKQQSTNSTSYTSTPKVDPDELKKIYHDLAKRYHPDRAKTPEEQKIKEDIMKKINRAYQEKDLQTLKIFL